MLQAAIKAEQDNLADFREVRNHHLPHAGMTAALVTIIATSMTPGRSCPLSTLRGLVAQQPAPASTSQVFNMEKPPHLQNSPYQPLTAHPAAICLPWLLWPPESHQAVEEHRDSGSHL
jgi:hypothetical protein